MPRGRKKSQEPQEEKIYEEVTEANDILKQLCERYSDILWAVGDPKTIGIFGVSNAERPKNSDTLARIRAISGVFKAVLEKNNINLKHIIEVYFSDWNSWSKKTKALILFHECLHVCDPESRKLRKHSIQDFDIIIDKTGILPYDSENLPDLLGEKPVEFNKELVAKMQKENIQDDATPTPPE